MISSYYTGNSIPPRFFLPSHHSHPSPSTPTLRTRTFTPSPPLPPTRTFDNSIPSRPFPKVRNWNPNERGTTSFGTWSDSVSFAELSGEGRTGWGERKRWERCCEFDGERDEVIGEYARGEERDRGTCGRGSNNHTRG